MIKFEVVLQTQPKKYYQKVDSKTAKTLEKCFGDLEDNPFYKPGKIKRMKGRVKLFRYTLNGLRVVYEVSVENKKVGVLLIGPRGDIYKKI
ncbi:type II toxin-antitoxin system RelE/ParE family toxin [bacterium]|nr:hypothetical protein [bacterium]MBU3956177.1 type II toxin-antitoxin system RelE/ParE family toxin [bacterium]MBU4133890.1 type II toxin-antitoxin system RelE/ParE family toxin [bacterium]